MKKDFPPRLGVTLAEYDRLRDEVRANRDSFMAAFWSGYALQGYGKPMEEADELEAEPDTQDSNDSEDDERSEQ